MKLTARHKLSGIKNKRTTRNNLRRMVLARPQSNIARPFSVFGPFTSGFRRNEPSGSNGRQVHMLLVVSSFFFFFYFRVLGKSRGFDHRGRRGGEMETRGRVYPEIRNYYKRALRPVISV